MTSAIFEWAMNQARAQEQETGIAMKERLISDHNSEIEALDQRVLMFHRPGEKALFCVQQIGKQDAWSILRNPNFLLNTGTGIAQQWLRNGELAYVEAAMKDGANEEQLTEEFGQSMVNFAKKNLSSYQKFEALAIA